MNTTADRLEFAPPATGGMLRSFGLAIVAHLVLVAALAWGVHWKRSADQISVEAELWSSIPQQAAPRVVAPPPAPAAPAPAPARPPPPAPAPAPAPPPPSVPRAAAPDINLEREKVRLAKEKQEAEQRRLAREKQQAELQREQERREQQKLAQEKKRQQEQKLAEEKQKQEAETRRQETLQALQDAARLEAQRNANIARLAGLAGSTGAPAATAAPAATGAPAPTATPAATGAPAATGIAAQASGPSRSYGGRVAARVKPNIVFTREPEGNPTAVVEVRAAPDGTITARKLIRSSGLPAWDEAVLKAIDKTETLPRDTDGRVPPVLEISFRPRD